MSEITNIKKHVAMRLAGYQAMERVCAQELRAMTDEEAIRIFLSLKVEGTPWQPRPDWSGLIEQQAIFKRGRKQ